MEAEMGITLDEMIRQSEKKLARLRKLQAEEQRIVERAQKDPIYVPMEEGDPTDTLLNMAEWVKLIRGVVTEVLEERGL
jgi:hypothetical protein